MTALALQGGSRRNKDFEPRSRFGPVAIGVMVAFHALLGYALFSGLGAHVIEIVRKPLDATIIQEVKLPPPPPPPEQPRPPVKELPKLAPPPAYVPPPEVVSPAVPEPAPAITAVQTAEPVAPPPPAAPAEPAPPAVPLRQDIAVACRGQVRPAIPERALEEGISGKVRAEVRIRGSRVVDVQIVSGPKVFHAAVRAALAQYQCQTRGGEDVLASQDFEFKVE
jgi:protein TonB